MTGEHGRSRRQGALRRCVAVGLALACLADALATWQWELLRRKKHHLRPADAWAIGIIIRLVQQVRATH